MKLDRPTAAVDRRLRHRTRNRPDGRFCDGQQLAIAQNQALFAVLGTRFGGDGRVSFALPDLRAPVGNTHSTARAALDRFRRPAPVRTFGADFVICVEGSFPTRP